MTEFLADFLSDLGHQVFIADNGTAAERQLDECWPHLLILDFLLPQRNGFGVAETVRARPNGNEIPIIMMSGVFKNPKTVAEAKEQYDVVDFLSKPLDLPALERMIEDALDLIDPEGDVHPFAEKALSEAAVDWGIHNGAFYWHDRKRERHHLTILAAPHLNVTLDFDGVRVTCAREELPGKLVDELRWILDGGSVEPHETERAKTLNEEIAEALVVHADALQEGRTSGALDPFGGPDRLRRAIAEELARR